MSAVGLSLYASMCARDRAEDVSPAAHQWIKWECRRNRQTAGHRRPKMCVEVFGHAEEWPLATNKKVRKEFVAVSNSVIDRHSTLHDMGCCSWSAKSDGR